MRSAPTNRACQSDRVKTSKDKDTQTMAIEIKAPAFPESIADVGHDIRLIGRLSLNVVEAGD